MMMDDDPESSEDERAIELFALQATYPELKIDSTNPFKATLDLPVILANPLAVRFPAPAAATVALPTPPNSDGVSDDGLGPAEGRQIQGEIRHLAHLPPLHLSIELPDGYPSQTSPKFDLTCEMAWLSEVKLLELISDGHKLWEELGRDQVVFTYIDHLQQAAGDGFGLGSKGTTAIKFPPGLEIPLMDFDKKAKRLAFEQETFDCGICLEPKKGLVCHRMLLCSHVFCIPCLQDFYNTCITEGDVGNVKCLNPDCGKDAQVQVVPNGRRRERRREDDRTLEPSELLEIPLEREAVQRYVKLKRKQMLESDPTTEWCPRKWCQGPARWDKPKPGEPSDSDGEDEEPAVPQALDSKADGQEQKVKQMPIGERLAICEDCSFAFCRICKKGWHGLTGRSCYPRPKEELTAEEEASEAYLERHSTRCPTCSARCQKIMGCNHMICLKCRTHFCYLCSAWLTPDDPYIHYNSRSESCYMRLWELEQGDGLPREPRRRPPLVQNPNHDGPANIHAPHRVQPAPPPPPPPPAPIPPRPDPVPGIRVNARAQQGLVRALAVPPVQNRGPPIPGLQRFLQLAQNDEEEEWNSDELEESDGDDDDDDDRWEIGVR